MLHDRSKTAALLASIAMLPFATITPANAYAAPEASAEVADAGAGAGADDIGLTDIVVTATRRETSLQATPIAITVLGNEEIRKRRVQSLLDLADGSVPSLRIATFEARQSALTIGIRGIVPFDANQPARDQGVGVYIDGVYLGRQQGLNAALFDVERIEVLRGPQGTLFGRNTAGGALSIVNKAPTGEFGGRVSAGIGNFGSYNGEVHMSLPEVARVSIKLDGVVQHQNPTVRNPLDGQQGWNFYNRVGGRITALWRPAEGFSAQFSVDRARNENTPFYSQLLNYNPLGKTVGQYDPLTLKLVAPGSPSGTGTVCTTCIAPLSPLVAVAGADRQQEADIGVPQQPSLDNSHGFHTSLKWKVAPQLELRSITAWRGVTTEQWDNSGGAHRTIYAPNANFSRYSLSWLGQDQFSQEFQAVGSLPGVDYVVGAFYFNERVREFAATPSTNRWNASGTGYSINDAQAWNMANWARQRDSHATARSLAAFFQATWSPTDTLHLTAGGRYTNDKRDGELTMVQNRPVSFPFTYRSDRFDPMVTLAWDASHGVNLYAKYATGYRAGGANSRSQTFAPFGAETVQAYELGAKMDLLDRRVRLNLAGYMMNRTGTQIDFDNVDTNPSSPTFNLHTEETRNAPGKSRIRGLEAELTVRPADALTLGASYAYTYTDIPATPNPLLPGNPLTQVFVVFTPRHALSASADYEVAVTGSGAMLRFHLDANYAGRTHSFQNETTLTDPGFLVNSRLALAELPMNATGQTLTIAAWARNLFNEAHVYRRSDANAGTLGSYGNLNTPRTFGIEATMNF